MPTAPVKRYAGGKLNVRAGWSVTQHGSSPLDLLALVETLARCRDVDGGQHVLPIEALGAESDAGAFVQSCDQAPITHAVGHR